MRRTLVPLSLLVVATAMCALLSSRPAIAASGPAIAAPHILCPLPDPQAGPQVVACCPVPLNAPDASRPSIQPICCQPTACCLSASCCPTVPCGSGSLTITASPNPSTAGRTVMISGQLTGSSASGVQVTLWRERAGQSAFHVLATTRTVSAGHYALTLGRGKVMADQAWYVTANGLHSATIRQQVRALVGLSSSSRSATVGGGAVALHGHVTPSHAGERVLVEQSRGGGWRVIARARLDKTSSYTVSDRFAQTGPVRLRVVLPADARNTTSVSPTLTVMVKP